MLDIRHFVAFHSETLTAGNRLSISLWQWACRIFVDDTVPDLDMSNAAMICSKWIFSAVVIGRDFSTAAPFLSILESRRQKIKGGLSS